MPHTLWFHGKKIGETRFEHRSDSRRRAGVFHPTEFGLSVLPSITGMFPALVAFRALCVREGLDIESDDPGVAQMALDTYADTPEGQRVIHSARQLSAVELRDARGRRLVWESLAISDLEELKALAHDGAPQLRVSKEEGDERPPKEPVRFLISTTLALPGATENGEPPDAGTLAVC